MVGNIYDAALREQGQELLLKDRLIREKGDEVMKAIRETTYGFGSRHPDRSKLMALFSPYGKKALYVKEDQLMLTDSGLQNLLGELVQKNIQNAGKLLLGVGLITEAQASRCFSKPAELPTTVSRSRRTILQKPAKTGRLSYDAPAQAYGAGIGVRRGHKEGDGWDDSIGSEPPAERDLQFGDVDKPPRGRFGR